MLERKQMSATNLADPIKLTAKSAAGGAKKKPYLCHRTSKRMKNWQHPELLEIRVKVELTKGVLIDSPHEISKYLL